jgi:hypothetical protein
MAKFCEKLITELAGALQSEFPNDLEMTRYADFDLRFEKAPKYLEVLKLSPKHHAMLDRLSQDEKGRLSAVREALHNMAESASKRLKEAADNADSRQRELVA